MVIKFVIRLGRKCSLATPTQVTSKFGTPSGQVPKEGHKRKKKRHESLCLMLFDMDGSYKAGSQKQNNQTNKITNEMFLFSSG